MNHFCNFFSSIARKLAKAYSILTNWKYSSQASIKTTQECVFKYISKLDIVKQLKCLKRGKIYGLGGISRGFIKDIASVLAGPLSHILNLSLKTCKIPSEWKNTKSSLSNDPIN